MPSPARQVRESGPGFSTGLLSWRKGADIPVDSRCAACRPRLTAAQGPRVEQRAIVARTRCATAAQWRKPKSQEQEIPPCTGFPSAVNVSVRPRPDIHLFDWIATKRSITNGNRGFRSARGAPTAILHDSYPFRAMTVAHGEFPFWTIRATLPFFKHADRGHARCHLIQDFTYAARWPGSWPMPS